MHRNERRAAIASKRFNWDAGRLGVIASGQHLTADNDEPEYLAYGDQCMRCGREGHSSDECERPVPAWPAVGEDLSRAMGERGR